MSILEQDTFTRANQSGWGTASNGDTWATNIGSPTLSIASNEGHATGISAQSLLQLGSTTSADAEVLVRVQCSASTSTRMGPALRIATNNGYIGRLSATANNLLIGKIVSGTETDLTNVSFTVSTATFYYIRYRIVGTNHFLKAWASGTAEPNSWNINAFSDSSITSAGGVGVTINASSTSVTWDFDSFFAVDYPFQDTLTVTDTPAPTVVAVPTESLTSTETNLDTVIALNTDSLTTTEVNNPTVIGLNTDSLTTTETTVETVVFIPTDTLTNNEINAFTVANTNADTVSVLDTSTSTIIGTITDTLTSVETFLNTVNSSITEVSNLSEVLSSTLALAVSDSLTSTDSITSVSFVLVQLTDIALTVTESFAATVIGLAIDQNTNTEIYSSLVAVAFVDTLTFATMILVNVYLTDVTLILTEITAQTLATTATDTLTSADSLSFALATSVSFVEILTLVESYLITLTVTDTTNTVPADISITALSYIPTAELVGTSSDSLVQAFTWLLGDTSTVSESLAATILALQTDISAALDQVRGLLAFTNIDTNVLIDSSTTMPLFGATDTLVTAESYSEALSYVSIDSLSLIELNAIVLLNSITDSLTELETVTYALAVSELEQVGINELITIALNYAATQTVTVQEIIQNTVVSVPIDALSLVENVLYLLAYGVSTYNTLVLNNTPAAYYKMNEASGTNATDASGNGNTGTYSTTGVTYNNPGAISGISDGSIGFTTGQLNFAGSLTPSSWTTWTLECWVYLTVVPATTNLFLVANPLSSQPMYVQAGSVALVPFTWYYMVETFDGTYLTFYLNAKQQAQVVYAPVYVDSIVTDTFSGYMGNIALYPSLLTPAMIQNKYGEGLAYRLEQNTVLDILAVQLSLAIADTLTVLDTLSAILATSFTGWTDSVTVQDVSTTTVIGLQINTSNLTDIYTYGVVFVPVDQLAEIEVYTVILATNLQDTMQVVDSGLFGIGGIVTEILSVAESVFWTVISVGLDTILTVSETASYSLLNTITDQSTVLDLLSITILPVLTPDSVTVTELAAYGIIAVPIEQLTIRDTATFVLVWVTSDISLTVLDLLTGLGYAFIDIPLIVSDVLSFTETLYRLAYVRVRSGQGNTIVRSGATYDTTRSSTINLSVR